MGFKDMTYDLAALQCSVSCLRVRVIETHEIRITLEVGHCMFSAWVCLKNNVFEGVPTKKKTSTQTKRATINV